MLVSQYILPLYFIKLQLNFSSYKGQPLLRRWDKQNFKVKTLQSHPGLPSSLSFSSSILTGICYTRIIIVGVQHRMWCSSVCELSLRGWSKTCQQDVNVSLIQAGLEWCGQYHQEQKSLLPRRHHSVLSHHCSVLFGCWHKKIQTLWLK